MSRTWLIAAVPVVALAVFVFGPALSAGPQNAPSDSPGVFANKVLSISSKTQGEFGAVLEKVQMKQLGGKSFLVGIAVDTGEASDWTKGRITWYPIDDAGQIIEFDNIEQMMRAHRGAAP